MVLVFFRVGLEDSFKAGPVTPEENHPEDRCNQTWANAARVHAEVIVQNVHKNRRQNRDRERHITPCEKQYASDQLDKEYHAHEVRGRNRCHELQRNRVRRRWLGDEVKKAVESNVMNCNATGFDGGGWGMK
jgi:hypothetical protein